MEFGKLENGTSYFDGIGKEPWFHAQFTFKNATIKWNDYIKIAWYEEKH